MRFKRFLFLLISFHIALHCSAVDEIRNSRIEGSSIAINGQLSVKDDKFPAFYSAGWDNGFASMKNTGKVEFGLDETKHILYGFDFDVKITFDVIATDKYNQPHLFKTQNLSITYTKAGGYKDKAQLMFDGFVKLDVVITSVVSKNSTTGGTIATPQELFLEAEIATNRNYLFYNSIAPNTNPANFNNHVIASCVSGTPSELEIFWDYVPGVEEYELEWTWVNNYSTSAQMYDFRFDATRIITKNTFYRIPLTYENGFIVYRLRHVGRGGANFDMRVEGPWTNFPDRDVVSNYPSNLQYQVISFASDAVNWSSTMTFDENGRKGSGVSYMDGMLMGRQSLAKLNTDNKVIAQSVIYDFQGRPAISILPVPLDKECLSYQNGLNNNTAGSQYTQTNFDDDGANACINATDLLNTNSGASNYYSSVNKNKEGEQGYLPDAAGLPFVQVEYTNDMTGRIKSQTMPGEAHKLGTGKETKFYYSNPGDGELYQLFGSEVGNVKHYDKNIVKDANGQLSASYIDMEGRVIATSLLGPKPANVDGIDGYNDSAPFLDKLDKYNIVDEDNHSITSVKNIFNEQAGATQTFTYEFMPEDYYDVCTPTLCFDCIYEFEFKVTDECNANVITPITAIVGNLSQSKFDINNCDAPSLIYEMSPGGPLSVTFPNVGNYHIIKSLKVSDINLDKYVASYIANNKCFDDYETILQKQIDGIDFSSCNTDCQSCLASVSSYTLNYPSTHPTSPALTQTQIDDLLAECDVICENQLDPCFMTKQQMLMDFHPNGQYAGYSTSTGNPVVYSSTDNTSILSSSNVFGVSYNNCTLNYVDENGNPDHVSVYRNGVLFNLPVCALTIEEFVNNFKPSWANVFINYHPEKCYLDFCEANKESDKYDYSMLQVNTYDEAYAKGYLKPLNTITVPSLCPTNVNIPSTLDPFFNFYQNGQPGAGNVTTINTVLQTSVFNSYKDLMTSYFANYPENSSPSPTWVTLFDAAKVIGRGNTTGPAFGCDPCTKDQEWVAFRALYLGQKMRIFAQAKTDYVINNGCFNGCMQNSGLQPFKPTFTNPSPISPPYTSLNFLKGNFISNFIPVGSPFYQYYTLTAYPINKSPYTLNNTPKFHDDFDTQSSSGLHPCSQNSSGAFDNKVAHFQQLPFDINGLVNYYNDLLSSNPNSGPGVVPSNPTGNASTTSPYCQNTCESYAEQWINKLKYCNPIFDISSSVYNVPGNVAIRNQIMTELINVCVNGCDTQNPFGSSTTNPSISPAPAYTSFQQVINHFATLYPSIISNPNSLTCSALNLDFPEPYGHDYSGASSGAQNKLDTCGCNKILATQTKYNQLFAAGTLPSGVNTIEQYFEHIYATPILNFNELACKCSATTLNAWTDTYQWSQAQSVSLLSNGIPVPEILSCSKCLPCSTVVNAVNAFNATHATWINKPEYNELLENSLNASLNMNLIYSDYLDYYNNCVGVVNTALNTTPAQMEAFLNQYANAQVNVLPSYTPITYPFTNINYNVLPGGYNSAYPVLSHIDKCSVLNLNIGDIVNYAFNYGFSPIQITGFYTDNFIDGIRIPYIQFPAAFIGFGPNIASTTAVGLPGSPFNGLFQYSNVPYPNSPCLGSTTTECQLIMQDLSSVMSLPGFQIVNISFSGLSGQLVSGLTPSSSQVANFYYEYIYNDVTGHPVLYKNNYGYYGCIYQAPYPVITLCNQPLASSAPIYEDCMTSMLNQAETNAQLIYKSYVDKYTALFKKNYYEKCLKVKEKYERLYTLNEYHYTLYYYDQSGNLVRTVAPKGVSKLTTAQVAQLQLVTPPTIYPLHSYVTNYKYQSYGAPINSKTPDETDKTDYVYDNIGRIQLSFNGQQKINNKYSYTFYDVLGRIKEVGVLNNLPVSVTLATLKSQIASNNLESYISSLSGSVRNEVISTKYDFPLNSTISSQFGVLGQTNLRNRVTTVTYENVNDNNSNTYNYATHYTYDEHGNVGRIIQDIPALNPIGKEFYTLDYDYDLISGNVNKVTYQKGNDDQFMHKYEYDDDNRLHKVYTSRDNVNWDRDAKYFYNVQNHDNYQNTLLSYVYVYSFNIDPTRNYSNNGCDFSRLDNAQLQIESKPQTIFLGGNNYYPTDDTYELKCYATNFNILVIKGGLAGVKYSN